MIDSKVYINKNKRQIIIYAFARCAGVLKIKKEELVEY